MMPDNLTPQQRKRCMSHVKSKNTDIEMRVRSELHKLGYRYKTHVKELPGKPDIVFTKARVAIFIDGDFWHGYRFRTLKPKLSPFWQDKISKNRERDYKNFVALKELGWKVLRIWKHSILKDFDGVIERIILAISTNS
jgi:DNA mismatch endonuclease (patch repair protein)